MKNRNSSVLVIFGKGLPVKKNQWWEQVDRVIADKCLEKTILDMGKVFINIEDFVDYGSVQEASKFLTDLSHLNINGGRVSKLSVFGGYELWWVHYSDLFLKFCVPYTEYKRLLAHLKDFSMVFFYKSPAQDLFCYFLNAYGCRCEMLDKQNRKLVSLNIIFQVCLSLLSFVWLVLRCSDLLIWTGDKLDGPKDYDFRMEGIYKELRAKNTQFVEFIRSGERGSVLLKHALRRKRAVIYSHAIIVLANQLSVLFRTNGDLPNKAFPTDPREAFPFLVATHYLRMETGTRWSIKLMKMIISATGIKAAIINDSTSRNMHEVLACKLLGIKVIGIQHGVSMKNNLVSDFMPGFDGPKHLSVDMFGLWSEWWKEYYLINSEAYKPEQLYVSGPMRPLKVGPIQTTKNNSFLRVLFVSQQGVAPQEVMPYLVNLLAEKDLEVCIKFRFSRDVFEQWLKDNQPEILNQVKTFRGDMHEAIAQCDVVVGSHSTGVLEALLQLKPCVFFRTVRWGDYFELGSYHPKHHFFAENPEELAGFIKESKNIPISILQDLRSRFFGDSNKNGSKWVVDQALSACLKRI